MRKWNSLVIAGLAFAAAACGPTPFEAPTATAAARPVPDESADLRVELAQLESRQRSLQAEIAAQRDEIERGRAALSQSEAARKEGERAPLAPRAGDPPETIHGVVQAVNNNVEILIVSAGARDGVTLGTEFSVVRAGETVATIVIDKTFPNYSAGSFKPFTPRTQIQSGDLCVGRALTCLPK